MRLVLAACSFMLLCGFALVETPLPDPAQEARAQTLFKQLRCPTCIAQSIHDSNADIASDLRVLVRERIAQGQSDDQIKAYLSARYGDLILLKPPVKTRTLPLWFAPWILFLGGGIAVFFILRRHGAAQTPSDDHDHP